MATKYRKKPVVIEAMRVTPKNVDEVAAWCGGRVFREAKPSDPTDVYIALDIPTLEGVMRAETFYGGDYIIRGVQGEFYPCKPDIFDATYELEDESEAKLTRKCPVCKGEPWVPCDTCADGTRQPSGDDYPYEEDDA